MHDKHARAYEVLFEERSKRMLAARERLPDWTCAQPEKSPLCVNCHVYPDLDQQPQRADVFRREDGVSCEACHGPAEKWLTRHYRWKGMSAREKEAFGMRDTKSLVGRAGVCVGCHVGQPGNEVNHDLIAAGHPRLAFEFGAYHANMPHHWNSAKEKIARADFEARAWVIGQLVVAQASLKLLQHRAGNKELPWPELAEHACYSCHHSLHDKSWRQEQYLPRATSRTTPKAGLPAWGTWYWSVPRYLARDKVGQPFLTALDLLDTEMAGLSSDRAPVVAKAAAVDKELARLLGHFEFDKGGDVAAELSRFAHEGRSSDWDSACQLYLGLSALGQALQDMKKDAPSSPALENMAKNLRFSHGRETPEPGFLRAFREDLNAVKNRRRPNSQP